MTQRDAWIQNIQEVGRAVRRPEELASRWAKRHESPAEAPSPLIFAVLLLNAMLGVAAYGLIMPMHNGLEAMMQSALLLPLAAGAAWTVALPSLYIIKRIFGSEIDHSTLTLVALITVSFGALAMLASIPVTLFFGAALPYSVVRIGANLLVFGGVGFCMGDVLLRTMRAVEPGRMQIYPVLWLGLLSLIGAELMWLFGIFNL